MIYSAVSAGARPLWRWCITLLLVLVLGYLIVGHRDLFAQAVPILRHARLSWWLTALLASALTFLIAAALYITLALKKLLYFQTVLVELAASFANRLLPAGLGGLGLHGLYLRRRMHTTAEATAVVSINNLLGIAAHLSLLLCVFVLRPSVIDSFAGHAQHIPWLKVGIGMVLVCIVVLVSSKVRSVLARFARNLLRSLHRLRPAQILRAYSLALLLTATYTLALYAASRSVGIQLPVLQTFIVFSIGMLAGTATPTPGGLVGIEAGLYAGLVGYDVSGASAAAVVLLYRLATYWIPLLPGFGCLLVARQRKIV